jgi:outer membrane autotransporter protein
MNASQRRFLALASAMAAMAALAASPLNAQVTVTSAAQLQTDINDGDTNFVLGNSFAVTSPIYIGTTSSPTITINGGGYAVTGTTEIFFVQSGNVTLSNLTLSGNAVGGNGGSGQASGGGALGAGGAIFVGSTARVTASSVNFANDSATGGNGGATVDTGGGGGGGVNGGTGGSAITLGGGGGGGNGGAGGSGNHAGGGGGGLDAAGGSSVGSSGGTGGGPAGGAGGTPGTGLGGGANSGGGGGGNSLTAGGAGGVNGGGGGGRVGAGAGGTYGGGGGSNITGGNGGFGGGGGAGAMETGGSGGFGGGGGASTTTLPSLGGVGGGSKTTATVLDAGGGGAGLGGAVFEQAGGEFIETGSGTYTGNSVTAGTGGRDGAAAGSSIFVMTGAGIIIAPGTGNTITVNGTIADDSASSLPAGGSYTPGSASGVGIQFGSATSVSGTVLLTGANTYSGGDTITDAAVVEAGSPTALGTGPVNNTAGVLTVGGSNHTIVATGFTQSNVGILTLNVAGSGMSATPDLLHVTNSNSTQATLGGTLVINFSGLTGLGGGAAHTLSFTMVETNAGYTGTFTLDSLGLTGATASLAYAGDDVNVQISVPASTIAALGLTANEQGILSPINQAIVSGQASPALTTIQTALQSLPVTEVGGALDQLSAAKFHAFASTTAFNNEAFFAQDMDSYLDGERTGPHGTFAAGNGQIDTSGFVVNDPNVDPGLQMLHSRMLAWNQASASISDIPGAVLGGIDLKAVKPAETPVAPEQPWNVFLRGSVVLAQGFSQADVPHFDDNTASVTAGADYRVTNNFLTGLTFSYAHTDVSLDDFGSSATVDSYSPGIYASYADSGWFANFIGRYSYNTYTDQRAIAFLGQSSDGATDGNEGMVDLDGGYDFHSGAWTYGPVAGVQYTHLTVNGYAEQNSVASLAVNEDQSDSLRSRLGGEVRFDCRECGVAFSPHLTATWQHEFLDASRGITSQFTQFSGGSFTVRTPNASDDSALVDVGLDAHVNDTITVFGDYLMQAGQDDYFGQSVQAGVRVNF